MVSSEMLRRVALVITDVSEVLSASFIDEIGTMLAVTSDRRGCIRLFFRNCLRDILCRVLQGLSLLPVVLTILLRRGALYTVTVASSVTSGCSVSGVSGNVCPFCRSSDKLARCHYGNERAPGQPVFRPHAPPPPTYAAHAEPISSRAKPYAFRIYFKRRRSFREYTI
jgi:hypothetical protein